MPRKQRGAYYRQYSDCYYWNHP